VTAKTPKAKAKKPKANSTTSVPVSQTERLELSVEPFQDSRVIVRRSWRLKSNMILARRSSVVLSMIFRSRTNRRLLLMDGRRMCTV
jgi:hypothetical protein